MCVHAYEAKQEEHKVSHHLWRRDAEFELRHRTRMSSDGVYLLKYRSNTPVHVCPGV